MSNALRKVRAKVRGRHLELMEDVALPDNTEVTVAIETAQEARSLCDVLDETAGAWSDEQHPELGTRDDVLRAVRGLRSAFERGYGG